MALDPNIILNAGRGVQPIDVAGSMRNALLIREDQQRQQQNALMMQERQAQMDRANRLRGVLAGLPSDATDDQRIGSLRGAGFFDEADKLESGILTRRKTDAEIGKTKAETLTKDRDRQLKEIEAISQRLRPVKNQAEYDLVYNWGVQTFGPEAMRAIPAQYDPRWQEQALNGLLSQQQALQDQRDRERLAETKRSNLATEATQRGNLAVAQGNLAMRGKEFNAAQAERERAAKEGKPLNETQSKALLFGTRMQEAGRVLNQLEDQGVKRPGNIYSIASSVPLVGDALGAATNWTQSEAQQQVDNAKRDFITAVLRRESGAAIAQSEFDTANKQYFPQVGDSPSVIAQKRALRERAVQAMLAEVPESRRNIGGAEVAGAAPVRPAAVPPMTQRQVSGAVNSAAASMTGMPDPFSPDAIAAELARRGVR